MLNFLKHDNNSQKVQEADEPQSLRVGKPQKLAQGNEEAQIEPDFPSLQEAKEIHDQSLFDHGQPEAHLINPGGLEGALGRAANYWHYGDGTPEEKMADSAAALAHGVGAAQAFEDGNKRTAYHTARYFLDNNGYGHLSPVEADDEELADHLLGHGEGTHSLEDTQALLRSRMGQQHTANILDPIHDALDLRVWDRPASSQPKLKQEHSEFIHEKIFGTLEENGYDGMETWLSLVFTGSLTTYQYSDDSDVDISLFVDTANFPEWSRAEMVGIMIANCDGTILPGTPFPLQCFVVMPGVTKQDLYKPGLRSGYDLATDMWIVPPDKSRVHDVESEMNEAYTVALENADKMDRLLRYEPDKAIQFWHQIHKRRQRDMKKGKGDYSASNITYKMLANRGLFPQISDVSGEYIAKMANDESFWDKQWEYEDAHSGEIDPRFQMTEHDYDPRNEYEIRMDQIDHPLLQAAQTQVDQVAASPQGWFNKGHVYPAREGMTGRDGSPSVGQYINGTYNEPVILLNLDAHKGYEDQIPVTVNHELRHAMQQWEDPDTDFNEDDAEGYHFGKKAHYENQLADHLPEIERLTWEDPSDDNWCGESAQKVSDYLKSQGIPHSQVGTPENTNFLYGHHDWIQLDDGTVLDPTITQFGLEGFPGTEKTAVIPPDHPLQEMYNRDPEPSTFKVAHYENQLEQIAQSYNNAPTYQPEAHAAWEELAADSAKRAAQIRQQYNFQVTDDPEPYANGQEMLKDIRQGNFTVSRANSEHPIWTPEQNVDFRTVHDVLGHGTSGADFSWEGENQACAAHAPYLSPAAQKALFTECIAQTAAANYNGGFGPQKTAFLPQVQIQPHKLGKEGDGTLCHRHIRSQGRIH